MLHYPQDFQKKLLTRAASVTPETLQAVARKYLEPANAYEVKLLP